MSRWLKGLDQVSNLIEKLDDRVATAADRDRNEDSDDEYYGGDDLEQVRGIENILSKRGLDIDDSNDEVEDAHMHTTEEENENDQNLDLSEELQHKSSEIQNDTETDNNPTIGNEMTKMEEGAMQAELSDDISSSQQSTQNQEPSLSSQSLVPEAQHQKNLGHVDILPQVSGEKKTHVKAKTTGKSKREMELTVESKEAQKEVRTLRKHVVKLNSTLEQAEDEIVALRKELEQAAEQMQKDRMLAKKQKEDIAKKHSDELKVHRDKLKTTLKETESRHTHELESLKDQLAQLRSQRAQEGGNWNIELTQAAEREQEMKNRLAMVEDEKSTLLSQINTLQNQQTALGSRIESLTQTSENALLREREAENRLDSVLNQHARQISQRQSRETELERTIQDLNEALAKSSGTQASTPSNETMNASSSSTSRAKIDLLESELNNVNSQLELEIERSNMLHKQLKEMSKESTQEASSIQVKQFAYQREVAEMTLKVSRLEACLREERRSKKESDEDLLGNEGKSTEQVKLLSEEVFRLRESLANSSGEHKALKSRLKSATARAEKAEDALAATTLEMSPLDRKSVTKGNNPRRKGVINDKSTIRSAMKLVPGQGDRSEQIGNVVDAVDSFTVTTGKYLRRNPLARAGFILYLILVHVWTFFLLFMHAHNFETNRADFGTITHMGPDALVQQHKEITGQTAAQIQMKSP